MASDNAKDIAVIILAAGLGTRMKSDTAKVFHPLLGKPMIVHVLKAAGVGAKKTILVLGHQADRVKEAARDFPVQVVLQERQLGTGHAVLQAEKALEGFAGDVVILSGDVPLIRDATVHGLIERHRQSKCVLTMMTAVIADPTGYGRVIKNADGSLRRVVEHKDASPEERGVREINTGIYCIAAGFLFSNLKTLKNDNAQGEYYLPDLIAVAVEKGLGAGVAAVGDVDEVMGINNRVELAHAEKLLRARTNEYWMREGVTFMAPDNTYVDDDVTIGRDVLLYPGCMLQGRTVIGDGCTIGPWARIVDSRLGDNVKVLDGSVIEESTVDDGCFVGPLAHLRPAAVLGKGVHVGNFVEIKKSEIGDGSKANHLSYIGDSIVGKRVNVGAGAITCNYDGVKKHQTIIEDDVFVGSDTQLVAPVRVGRGAVVAAGTTVTRDVPAESLAVSRVRQENREGWATKRRGKSGEKD